MADLGEATCRECNVGICLPGVVATCGTGFMVGRQCQGGQGQGLGGVPEDNVKAPRSLDSTTCTKLNL